MHPREILKRKTACDVKKYYTKYHESTMLFIFAYVKQFSLDNRASTFKNINLQHEVHSLFII